MVKYAEILSSNKAFFSEKSSQNLTAVFVGATNGIGLGALRAFARHTSGTPATIYVVGRTEKQLSSLKETITSINTSATFIPVLATDLTTLEDAKLAADEIARHVSRQQDAKVDLLIMSPGYVGLNREDNGSGVDRVQSIRFYSRMVFLNTLAPYLRKSSHARVVSVLAGGLEGNLFLDDMALEKNFSLPKAADHGASEVSLYLEEFAKRPENQSISLVHEFPGLTGGTGLSIKGLPGWAQFLFDHVATFIFKIIGYSVDEAGERALYAATTPKFSRDLEQAEKGSDGVVGSGAYIVHSDSSAIPSNKVLDSLRGEGAGQKVWEWTSQVLSKVNSS
ncbi:hypothetical protein BU24DRAFT_422704 [Aaosphaeria arxii CBS 175.79]|uniref:NAD(P)-binding protein n=1 Tax=Aaosphaeria arxii CBS 175.79 TaxID=1450172 RepID=A0A6A5XT24_9PLEO|nr:uncharacterized protein BU24DRAFT_422704 [Aaosphaeria arxii CBS 175.79]KAF2016352.1 hypothetical protein BU24DRAFT_422704 [Aaosphaeria arxii CBS 175.79]